MCYITPVPPFPNCSVLCPVLFLKGFYVSALQAVFSFVGVQCEMAAKAGMIIQRVVLNSRPGMYFIAVRDQCVCHGCLIV